MKKIVNTNNGKFNYRVAGLLIQNNKVLLQRAEIDDFWTLPGGEINFFETFEQAIEREIMEEIQVKVKVERIVWLLENFFEYHNEKYHSIEVCLLLTPLDSEDKIGKDEFYGIEEYYLPEKYGKLKLIFKWMPIDELDNLNLKPKKLKQELKTIPKTIKHIQNMDI
ncbi:MAG: NUDIX hydrolase [Candidatus Thorarchaeota archaeon]